MNKLKGIIIFVLIVIAVFFFIDKCSTDNRPTRDDLLDDRPTRDDLLDDDDLSDIDLFDDRPTRRGNNDLYDFLFACFVIGAIGISGHLLVVIPRFIWIARARSYGVYDPSKFHKFTKFLLPWRFFFRYYLKFRNWKNELFSYGKKSTSKWASPVEAAYNLFKPGYFFLGRLRAFGFPLFQPVGLDAKRHITIFAGTGSGKTTYLITLLGLHEGNALVIDPKGQMAKVLARAMSKGGNGVLGKGKKVQILDPSRTTNGLNDFLANWNPFVEIHRAEERAEKRGLNPASAVVSFAQKIVDGLIIRYDKENPFWTGAAKDFLFGLILDIYTSEPPERQTLGRLYELLQIGLPEEGSNKKDEKSFGRLLFRMSENQALGGAVAKSVAGIEGVSLETEGSILITMREQLKWLKNPALVEVSENSTFHLEELHSGDLVLFVCAKLTEIQEDFPGWFRLLTVLAVKVFEDINQPLKHPCLFAIDEFPSLGKVDIIDTSASFMRSFGIRLLLIAQNIKQLEVYKDWENFIGNSECTIWMENNHNPTFDYLSNSLDKSTRREKVRSGFFSDASSRYQLSDKVLMTRQQLSEFLGGGNVIVTRYGGKRPLKLKSAPYYNELPVFFYEADSDFEEKPRRAYTRKRLSRTSYDSFEDLSEG